MGEAGSSSSVSPGHAGEGVFRTFPMMKNCDTTCALLVGTASALEPMDAGAFWRADGARGGGGGAG